MAHSGTDSCDFGNGVTVNGTSSNSNVLLMKYNSSGEAQWAKSVTSGTSLSILNGIALDTNGNIYVVGKIFTSGTLGFGNGVFANGTAATAQNLLLIKYDNNGTAQWAKSVTSGPYDSEMRSVATDSDGNIYCAGFITESVTYGFGNGVTVSGAYGTSNILLVKYDSSGEAEWAKSVDSATSSSDFESIVSDTSGNIYAVGGIGDSGPYDFGSGVTVTGGGFALVKYNNTGGAQWAKSMVSGSSSSFESVTLDKSNNIYAAGYKSGTGLSNFGNNVTVSGASSLMNLVLIKYNNSGIAQWAKSTTSGTKESFLMSVVVDNSTNAYVGGSMYGNYTYGLGNGVTVKGLDATGDSGHNFLMAKYNRDGDALWAKSVTSGSDSSSCVYITLDGAENIYAVGAINGVDQFGFGDGVVVDGVYNFDNPFLVKYQGPEIASSSSSKQPIVSSSSSSNAPVVSGASSITHRLPALFVAGEVILLLF